MSFLSSPPTFPLLICWLLCWPCLSQCGVCRSVWRGRGYKNRLSSKQSSQTSFLLLNVYFSSKLRYNVAIVSLYYLCQLLLNVLTSLHPSHASWCHAHTLSTQLPRTKVDPWLHSSLPLSGSGPASPLLFYHSYYLNKYFFREDYRNTSSSYFHHTFWLPFHSLFKGIVCLLFSLFCLWSAFFLVKQ